MIAWLKGTVLRKGENWMIVSDGNLGYKVFSSPAVVLGSKIGDSITLWMHEQQRDDGREFYGFQTPDELELFWKLITVSGVGPKAGLTIVGSNNVAAVRKWIDDGNIAALSDIRGVGQKTAQKIVLDLKGMLAEAGAGADEAVDALVGLGYSREEARAALTGVTGEKAEDRLKSALKNLGKK
jgi:Holliday junction DNA helicase RuvA